MMPLTEIGRLRQTVADSWDSPMADQVAAQWGYPAGTARWWRSSASHVFVLPGSGTRRFLRLVPGTYRSGSDVAAVAELMAQLSRAGSAVVRLDNMAWAGDRPVAYDFDEAAISWFAADIASAVRDLTGPAAAGYRPRLDAFIAGYRSLRPLDDQDLARLRLFAGLHAAASLVRIRRALGDPGRDEPGWLAQLRGKLTETARLHRQLVIRTAGQVR
jgi:Ser/Thr protein kinase RdoA (MazF antagonist)